MTSDSNHVFIGSIVHWSTESNSLEYLDVCTMTVRNGTITSVTPGSLGDLPSSCADSNDSTLHILGPAQFLIPGFVDAHVHAPQYPNLGLGVDLPLLQWLRTYIFSLESKFNDLAFAETVYGRVVDRMLACGTTTASYFGTTHTDACLLLADIIHAKGQRAFVGKVNMTVNCCEDYGESVDESLTETERFVQKMKEKQYPRVGPIITPRFAVTCDMDTLTRLGRLAARHNLRVQTHLSENRAEIDTVRDMNPGCGHYTEVYERAGLLTKQTILAHSIHLSEAEMALLAQVGSSVIHCPSSNCFLQSGACDIVKLLEHNINIGLGTDMGAGYSPSILEVARRALEVSSVLAFIKRDGQNIATGQTQCSGGQIETSTGENKGSSGQNKDFMFENTDSSGQNKDSSGQNKDSSGQNKDSTFENTDSSGQNKDSIGGNKTCMNGNGTSLDQTNPRSQTKRPEVESVCGKAGKPLRFDQAFYFATMGGAKALNLDDKIGNFSPGKQFDALLINLDAPSSPVEFTAGRSLQEKFAKYFFTGDDRNVGMVFVDGRAVVDKRR